MLKAMLLVVAAAAGAPASAALIVPGEGFDAWGAATETFDHGPAARVALARLENGERETLAAEALDEMFNVAETLLDRRGHVRMADQLDAEWNGHYRGALLGLEDAGDHVPVSAWLAVWYAKLEGVLGVRLMELSHLRDIWVLNYTIPVAFSPAAASDWCVGDLAVHPGDTCEAEYRRHFSGTKYAGADPFATAVAHDGFAPVVVYWSVWAACEAATYGTGWFVICTPAGDLAEIGAERWVTPRISDAIYERSNSLRGPPAP